MVNPYSSVSVYAIKTENRTELVIIGFSRSNVARAFHGYSDTVLGTAAGGGYDKETSALGQAIENLFSVNLEVNFAAGLSPLKDEAKKHGITIYTLNDLVWGIVA